MRAGVSDAVKRHHAKVKLAVMQRCRSVKWPEFLSTSWCPVNRCRLSLKPALFNAPADGRTGSGPRSRQQLPRQTRLYCRLIHLYSLPCQRALNLTSVGVSGNPVLLLAWRYCPRWRKCRARSPDEFLRSVFCFANDANVLRIASQPTQDAMSLRIALPL